MQLKKNTGMSDKTKGSMGDQEERNLNLQQKYYFGAGKVAIVEGSGPSTHMVAHTVWNSSYRGSNAIF